MCKILTIFLIACFSMSAFGQEVSPRCTHFGGMKEKICPVSMVNLTSNYRSYFGKNVAITGYVRKVDNSFYLFTTKEFAVDRSMADYVLISGDTRELKNRTDSKVTIIGKVSAMGDFDYSGGLFWPFAKIEMLSLR